MAQVDIANIKETVRSVLDTANTTTASPLDLSSGLTNRIRSVMKLNPELIKVDAEVFPYVTIFTSKKSIRPQTIAGSQQGGKRRADLTFTVMGVVWNDYSSSITVDPADTDVEKLMENIEDVLRSNDNLAGYASWQIPTDVTYHSAPFDEDTHLRIGIMDLQVTVFY
jgi:hypothetical protein